MMTRWRNTTWKFSLKKLYLLAFFLLLVPTEVFAASAPNIITYQGRVLDANGVPLSVTSLSIKFFLYNALTGGTCVWSNSSSTCDANTPASTTARTVTLTNGLLTENLGDTSLGTPYAAIQDSTFADNASMYLEVIIGTETLSPRRQFTAAPYALNADTLDGIDLSVIQLWEVGSSGSYENDAAVIIGTDAAFSYGSGGVGDLRVADELEAIGSVYAGGNLVVGASTSATETIANVGFTLGGNDLFVAGDAGIEGTFYLDGTSFFDGALTLNSDLNLSNTGAGDAINIAGSATGVAINIDSDTYGTDLDLQNGLTISNDDVNDLIFSANGVSFNVDFAEVATGEILLSTASDLNFQSTSTNADALTIVASGIGANLVLQAGTGPQDAGENGNDIAFEATDDLVFGGQDVVFTFPSSNSDFSILGSVAVGSTSQTFVTISTAMGDNLGQAQYMLSVVNGDNGGVYTTGPDALVMLENNDPADPVVAGLLFVDGDSASDFTYGIDFGADMYGTAELRFGNGELIDNADSGIIKFSGVGGAFNHVLSLNLDVGQPAFSTSTATTVQFDELLMVDLQTIGAAQYALCHANEDTEDETIGDCSGAPVGDYAEQYPVAEGIDYGDIVVPGTKKTITESGQVITQLVKSSMAYQGPVAGIVSNNYGDFTSAGYNISDEENPMPVALVGRVPVNVTNENGPIYVGDYLTTSSTPGFAMKATEVGRVIGMALNDFSESSGQVMVQVHNGWYLGEVITSDGSTTMVSDKMTMNTTQQATESQQTVESFGLALRGSAWDGAQAQAVEMMLKNSVTDHNQYRLSVRNTTDTEVAYISNTGTMQLAGDLVITGNIYPSDRGTTQTSKYIYYDGSEGAGGDFMRTNAKGWSTGSYDFAEMYPSKEHLQAGEVVVFAGTGEEVKRSMEASSAQIAGIVSTRPGFLAGENTPGSHPIALAGRVPTKVSAENGEVKVGDPLTTSHKPGYAMKANKSGMIVGYALEPLADGEKSILVYVNVGHWGGNETGGLPGTNSQASGFASGPGANFSSLNLTGDINLTGNKILSVGHIAGISDVWSIDQNGIIKTEGLLNIITRSYTEEKIETIAVTSPESIITLTGTTTLKQGQAEVRFEAFAPSFNDVTAVETPLQVIVTPSGPVSLYVTEKDNNHFVVKQFAGDPMDVEFDWMVTAYRKGYEPKHAAEPLSQTNFESDVIEDAHQESQEATEQIIPTSEELIETNPVIETTETTEEENKQSSTEESESATVLETILEMPTE